MKKIGNGIETSLCVRTGTQNGIPIPSVKWIVIGNPCRSLSSIISKTIFFPLLGPVLVNDMQTPTPPAPILVQNVAQYSETDENIMKTDYLHVINEDIMPMLNN